LAEYISSGIVSRSKALNPMRWYGWMNKCIRGGPFGPMHCNL
jgi:hypothetical protein